MNDYEGIPEEPWTKTPNTMIDEVMHKISGSSIKVYMFILRNTWGYQEYKSAKKITTNEFMKGRKNSDGSRMSHGTGLSKVSVIKSVRELIDKNIIECEIDDSDPGRCVKKYRIVVGSSPQSDVEQKQGGVNGDHRVQELYKAGKETVHADVQEVYTDQRKKLIKKPRKKRELSDRRGLRSQEASPDRRKLRSREASSAPGLLVSEFDESISKQIIDLLRQHNEDIVFCPTNNSKKPLSYSSVVPIIAELRGRFSEERIKEIIDWLQIHYGKDYIPRIRRKSDISRFKRFEDAMLMSRDKLSVADDLDYKDILAELEKA